jgi:chemotaxis family two-component system sensor kinase Cph1
LAYIASHDLKEPLRGIHHTAQFMEEDYAAQLDDQGKGRLRTLMELSKRMDDRINGLFEYARLTRAKLHKEVVEVGALVSDVIQSLTPPASRS